MAEKSSGAEALLAGMADEMAAIVRTHFDALKDAPVVAEPGAVDKVLKALVTAGRANLMVRAVKAAEDKLAADRQRRISQVEQTQMDEITPDELEQRADELRARIDRIMAALETKRRSVATPMARPDAGPPGQLDRERARRAA